VVGGALRFRRERWLLLQVAAFGLLASCGLPEGLDWAAGDAYLEDPESRSWAVQTVCGGPDTVPGIDVSHWQGTIDWDEVWQNSVQEFAYVRIGDGLGTDTQFERNWAEARRVGLLRGAYHFFRPDEDPQAQAEHFLQRVNDAGGFEPDDLPSVLDIEVDGGLAAWEIEDGIQIWVEAVQAFTGKVPVIYTGSYFWDDRGLGTQFSTHPLWTAHYTGNPCPLISSAWSSWTLWQFTSSGAVPGIAGNVDLNRFDGDIVDLIDFATAPAPDLPDLSIAGLSLPESARRGETIAIDYELENLGIRDADAHELHIRLSEDPDYDPSDQLLCDRPLTSLAGGAELAGSLMCTVPADSALGTLHVVASIDATGVIAETDESNNESSAPIFIASTDADEDEGGGPSGCDGRGGRGGSCRQGSTEPRRVGLPAWLLAVLVVTGRRARARRWGRGRRESADGGGASSPWRF
jgi:GH25 family lysozyme M1 (1,4-beta-N-acetylmuramidase)